jgi:hypothetical protein
VLERDCRRRLKQRAGAGDEPNAAVTPGR